MSPTHSLVALASLAALTSAPVAAQSVTAYGRLDVAVEYVRITGGAAADRTLKLLSNDGSRLGFRGTEDLGNGLRAMFNIEAALSPDTGTTSSTALFGRQSWVSIGSAQWGDVSFGRNYSPIDDYAYYFDAFQYGGNGATYGSQKYAARVDNSIKYISPKFGGGAEVRLLVGAPENTTGIGKTYAGQFSYFAGSFATALALQNAKIAGPGGVTDTRNDVYLGVSYDFKVVKPSLVYFQRKDTGQQTYKSLIAGANVPVGPGNIRANFGHITQGGLKSRTFAVGYWHPVSKRTSLYTAYANQHNNEGSQLQAFVLPTFNAIGVGQSANSFQAGIRHNF